MKPINLHPHEVRAALAGTLGLIVRPVKASNCDLSQYDGASPIVSQTGAISTATIGWAFGTRRNGRVKTERVLSCPFGQPGDKLWGRETWQVTNREEYVQYPGGAAETTWPSTEGRPHKQSQWNSVHNVIYKASGGDHVSSNGVKEFWRPSTQMPQWASRITLAVVSVDVKPVDKITEAEAMACGFERPVISPREIDGIAVHPMTGEYVDAFKAFWQKQYGDAQWAWFVNVKGAE